LNKRPDVSVNNGVAIIGGKPIDLRNIRIDKPIASGAHGSVFEGTEITLDRKVAVKIWYKTGEKVRDGAIGEARKLASITHPLFVTVYQLDIAETTPYSTMEFLPGPSLKSWLKEQKIGRIRENGLAFDYLRMNQENIRQRCAFWFLYSAGLRHLYSMGLFHGDPHVGNVIVFKDSVGTLNQLLNHHVLQVSNLLSIRMLDLGTSLLRNDPAKIPVRESIVIYETAERLFPDFNPRQVMNIDMPLEPKELLRVLDKYVEYVLEMSSVPGMTQTDFDFLSHGLPQLLGWCPFFNYEVINEHLTSLFHAHEAKELISSALWQMQSKDIDLSSEEFSRIAGAARAATPAENVQKLTNLSKQFRNKSWTFEPRG
jgi:serine/threonine protein kinase